MSSPPKIEDTVPLDPNEESDEYDEDFEVCMLRRVYTNKKSNAF